MGKDLLKKELGWVVGNDENIDLFEDQWIPTFKNEMVGRGMGKLFSSFKVAHLINQDTKSWREPLIRAPLSGTYGH